MKKVARSRHETFNARIKNFKILASKYRGNLHSHHNVFHSVVNMLQLDIEVGNKLIQIKYYDMNYKIKSIVAGNFKAGQIKGGITSVYSTDRNP